MRAWVKDGIFVHIIATTAILVPSNDGNSWVNRRKLWLHLVEKDMIHLVRQRNDYEWWQLTNEEKLLLENKKLVA